MDTEEITNTINTINTTNSINLFKLYSEDGITNSINVKNNINKLLILLEENSKKLEEIDKDIDENNIYIGKGGSGKGQFIYSNSNSNPFFNYNPNPNPNPNPNFNPNSNSFSNSNPFFFDNNLSRQDSINSNYTDKSNSSDESLKFDNDNNLSDSNYSQQSSNLSRQYSNYTDKSHSSDESLKFDNDNNLSDSNYSQQSYDKTFESPNTVTANSPNRALPQEQTNIIQPVKLFSETNNKMDDNESDNKMDDNESDNKMDDAELFNKIETAYTFNVVDLMPNDGLKGIINSFFYNNVSEVKELSQLIDDISINIDYTTKNNLESPIEENKHITNLEILDELMSNIDNCNSIISSRTLLNNKLSTIKKIYSLMGLYLNIFTNLTNNELYDVYIINAYKYYNFTSIYYSLSVIFPVEFFLFDCDNKYLENQEKNKFKIILNLLIEILNNSYDSSYNKDLLFIINKLNTFNKSINFLDERQQFLINKYLIDTTDDLSMLEDGKRKKDDEEADISNNEGPENTNRPIAIKRHKSENNNSDNEYINQNAGSCEQIEQDNINPLLRIKFLFEWEHDFKGDRVRNSLNISGDYELFNSGIYPTIKRRWEQLVNNDALKINKNQNQNENNYDRQLFNSLISKDKNENTYISTIINTLIANCNKQITNFSYLPIAEFKYTGEMTNFFSEIFNYYNNQLMCIKPHDEWDKEVHLYITSDNTPIEQLPEDKELGFNMQDMKTVDNIGILMMNHRKNLNDIWSKNVANKINNKDKVDALFSLDFKTAIKPLYYQAKSPNLELKTPASLIDPVTTGTFDLQDGLNIKQDDKYLNDTNINEAIKLASLYGINQLMNVWVNNKQFVKNYQFIYPNQNQNQTNGIKFYTSYDNSENNSFEWCVGDSTVNVIANALVNLYKPKDKRVSDARYDRLYKIVSIISNIPVPIISNIPVSAAEEQSNIDFMTILSFLKSCGDEYQRLTCEFFNYLFDENKHSFLAEYIPDNPNLFNVNSQSAAELGVNEETKIQKLKKLQINLLQTLNQNVFLLTKDRILIGESIEKNTPIYTYLQSPHAKFYDDIEKTTFFYELTKKINLPNLSNLTRKASGILTNRKEFFNLKTQVDYFDYKIKNNKKILNIISQISKKLGISSDEEREIINIIDNLPTINIRTIRLTMGENDPGKQLYDIEQNYMNLLFQFSCNKIDEIELFLNKIPKNEHTQQRIMKMYRAIEELRDLYNCNELKDFKVNNSGLIGNVTGNIDSDAYKNYEKKNLEYIEIQNNKIAILSKFLLGLEYYNTNSYISDNDAYLIVLNNEINKAISQTLNISMLDIIKIKSGQVIPTTLSGLKNVISYIMDEPHIVNKLFYLHDIATNNAIQKLFTYISNLNDIIKIFNKTTKVDNNIEFIQKIIPNIIQKYEDYINKLKKENPKFKQGIIKTIKDLYQAEILKSERGRRERTTSNIKTDDEVELEAIVENIREFQYNLNQVKQELQSIEQIIFKTADEEYKQYISSIPPNSKVKKQKQLKDFIKKYKNNTIEISELDKLIKDLNSKIEKQTKKEAALLVKISNKPKQLSIQTYEELLNILNNNKINESLPNNLLMYDNFLSNEKTKNQSEGSSMASEGSSASYGSSMETEGSSASYGSSMETEGSSMASEGSSMETEGSNMASEGSSMASEGSNMDTGIGKGGSKKRKYTKMPKKTKRHKIYIKKRQTKLNKKQNKKKRNTKKRL
jgi:hypothetical protein